MVTVSLKDKHLAENVSAILELKNFGYSDKEIQKMYNKQVEEDKKEDKRGTE